MDGRMQINEFISAFLDWEKVMTDKLWDVWVDKAFDKLDKDMSGTIDFDEVGWARLTCVALRESGLRRMQGHRAPLPRRS